MQEQYRKELEKQKIELEQTKKEKEKLATHNKFLDHDINGQSWQLKHAQKTAKGNKSAIPHTNNTTTPRKNRGTLLREGDGFNDDEIMIVSPSKSSSKSKGHTPKAGAKRKRDFFADSPAPALQLSPDLNEMLTDAPDAPRMEAKGAGPYSGGRSEKQRLNVRFSYR